MRAWRYPVAGGASIVIVGGVAYAVCRAAGAPHLWVIVLYAMAAASFIGGLVCDKLVLVRRLVASVVDLLNSVLGRYEDHHAEWSAVVLVHEDDQRIARLEADLTELKQRQAEMEKQADRDAEEIAKLRQETEKLSRLIASEQGSRAQVVTGAALQVLGIVLTLLASILWAVGAA